MSVSFHSELSGDLGVMFVVLVSFAKKLDSMLLAQGENVPPTEQVLLTGAALAFFGHLALAARAPGGSIVIESILLRDPASGETFDATADAKIRSAVPDEPIVIEIGRSAIRKTGPVAEKIR